MDEYRYDVVIVGSGPAGCATALALAKRAPALVPRTLILEKERHPRHKLCGGGITPYADDVLADLDAVPDVPSYPVDRVRFTAHGVSSEVQAKNILRIVRRDQFDAALADEVRARGFALHEEEPARALARENGLVMVETPAATYRAPIVVAADGATSLVRRTLVDDAGPGRISRLIEILTPEPEPERREEFREHVAVFDFTPATDGVQGYVWDFPSLKSGVPVMNRGLFDSRVVPSRPRADLKAAFGRALEARGYTLEDVTLMGHPERWFHPRGPFSAPNVLLVGDAAGVEPLAGEGISAALDYGLVAASAIVDALQRGDFTFERFRRRVLLSRVGLQLGLKSLAARLIYRLKWPWAWRVGIRWVGPALTALVRVPDRPAPPGSVRKESDSN